MPDPLIASMPIQFILGMFYTQVCHKARGLSIWHGYARYLLKRNHTPQIKLAFAARSRYKEKVHLEAAQPGWQISGEVVIRVAHASRVALPIPPTWPRRADAPARASHVYRAGCHRSPRRTLSGASPPPARGGRC